MSKPWVSDELWEVIAPLLPPDRPKPKGGQPPVDGGAEADASLHAVLLMQADAQAFWRGQQRIRAVPPLEIQRDGRPALLVRYESVTGSARLDGLFDRHTFALLLILGTGGQPA
jgi:hypothetical protein